MEDLTQLGIPVISEIEFAGRYTHAKKICITGSNGKTTTASLIYYLLKNAGLHVGLAGNVGQSFALQVATQDYDIYVLELSSFQLEGMYDFKADIAVLLNITPDHLNRYSNDLMEYARAKFRITQNLDKEDCFIFCRDDQITMEHLNHIVLKAQMLPISQKVAVTEGAFAKEGKCMWPTEKKNLKCSSTNWPSRESTMSTIPWLPLSRQNNEPEQPANQGMPHFI